MIRRGTFGLFAFISVQKPHLSARRAIKSEQLSLKGSGDAAALLAVPNAALITQGKQEPLSVNEQHNPEAEF